MRDSYKQSALMSVGTVVNSLLGLAFYIIIARYLGPTDFGNFSFLVGLGLLAAEVGDLGIGSAIVRFGSGDELSGIFTLSFSQRSLAMVVFFLTAFLASFIYSGNFYLSALVATSLQFLSLVTQTFLARQKYGYFVLTNIFGNTSRLALIALFWFSSSLGVDTALYAFSGANLIAFSLGFFLLLLMMRSSLFSFAKAKQIFKPVWQFSRWVALSFGVSSLGAKVDMPIVFALAGPSVTGIYASAQKLASIFQQLASSIEGVFAPKFSRIEEYQRHFQDYFKVTLIFVLGAAILIPLSPFVVPLFFGSKYLAAIGVFQILLVATIFFFASGPFSAAVLYKHGLSKYHLGVALTSFLVSLLAYFLLVPPLGAVGAGLVFVASSIVTLLGFVLVWKKLE